MVDFSFRVWGEVSWLLKKYGPQKWGLFGCVSPEIRSGHSLANLDVFVDNMVLARIKDSSPLNIELEEDALDLTENIIRKSVTSKINIFPAHLKASLDQIASYVETLVAHSPNVILDVTSLPKRWFFPILSELVRHNAVQNLVVVYSEGKNYASSLSENPEPLRNIPGFPSISGRTEHDYAFVGVGFHLTDFAQLFRDDRPKALQMLFPFPPGPPGSKSNWQFVQNVERLVLRENGDRSQIDPIGYVQLSAFDVSQAFDAMKKITSNGQKNCYMLPFGPKPISVAMCLYSIAARLAEAEEVPVFYAQPQRYSLKYTSEPIFKNGKISSYGYAVKVDGRLLYSM